VIEAKSQADEPSGPAAKNPHRQAEDMTAPEMFAERKKTLDQGRRPDMSGSSIAPFGRRATTLFSVMA
jgi:hypothetical protein